MINTKYIARPTDSVVEGVPGFMIYNVSEDSEEYNQVNEEESEEIQDID